VAASVLAFVTIMCAADTIERRALATGIVHEQVMDLCNGTRFIRLGNGLKCAWAQIYAEDEVTACGAVCQFRVKVLSDMDGCKLMPDLCNRFKYQRMSAEDCAGNLSAVQQGYGAQNVGYEECRGACDARQMHAVARSRGART